MQKIRPYVLSVGGFDTSGGAGVLADIKVFEQCKVVGLAVLTANTVQTETSFIQLDWVALEKIVYAIRQMMRHYPIRYIKIGILPNVEYLKRIIQAIKEQSPHSHIIWDPVLVSSSGKTIFETAGLENETDILSSVYLLTPNYDEYLQFVQVFGRGLRKKTNVLLKGGHRQDAHGEDILFQSTRTIKFQPAEIAVWSKHGSGCVLSSAIAAQLARGTDLITACRYAKAYTLSTLKSNPSLLAFHNL